MLKRKDYAAIVAGTGRNYFLELDVMYCVLGRYRWLSPNNWPIAFFEDDEDERSFLMVDSEIFVIMKYPGKGE
jgi:hypothetical protein